MIIVVFWFDSPDKFGFCCNREYCASSKSNNYYFKINRFEYLRAMIYLPALIEDCGIYLKKENLFRIVYEYFHLNYSIFKVLNGEKVDKILSKYYICFIRHRHLTYSIPNPAFSPLRRKKVSKEYSFVIEVYQNYHKLKKYIFFNYKSQKISSIISSWEPTRKKVH